MSADVRRIRVAAAAGWWWMLGDLVRLLKLFSIFKRRFKKNYFWTVALSPQIMRLLHFPPLTDMLGYFLRSSFGDISTRSGSNTRITSITHCSSHPCPQFAGWTGE